MRHRIINICLAIFSTLFFYTLIEVWGWRPNLQMVPLSIQQQLGFLDILAQPSKTGAVPKPGYVAIVGDSYAEGLGDTLMQVVHDGNPDFNAGHFLHRMSGRDVIAFGFRGGHPAWTYSFEVSAAVNGINRYDGIKLPPAGDVMAFFYEGNDINDLMSILRFAPPPWMTPENRADPDSARRYVEEAAQAGRERAYRRWSFVANAHMADTFGHLVKLMSKNIRKQGIPLLGAEDSSFRSTGYHENWARYDASTEFVKAGGTRRPYPAPTVESFVFHSDDELTIARVYFEASVRQLKALFPGARVHVVYIPSPINVYELDQPDIAMQDRIREANNTERSGPVVRVSKVALARVSNATCEAIRTASLAQDVDFIDTRAALRAASARLGYLHGPTDSGHFNRQGYMTLAEIMNSALATEPTPVCTPLPEG
jgi:hypothetical protein